MSEKRDPEIEESNKKHSEWQAVVREKGYLSEVSKFLNFISFGSEEKNWIEITFKSGTVRLDITENSIKAVGPFCTATQTAMNAAEITFRTEFKEDLGTKTEPTF